MYNEDMNELLNEDNITASAKVRLQQSERLFNQAKSVFKNELKTGKNAASSYSKLVRIVDSYPEEVPQIAVRRAVTTAGLAALSKSPYLYSYMTRCLKTTVNRLVRAKTVNGSVSNVLNSAIVNFEKRLKEASDNEIQVGIKTILSALRSCLTTVKNVSTVPVKSSEKKIDGINEGEYFDEEELSNNIDNLLLEAYNNGIIYFDDNDNCLISENLRSATRKVVGGVSRVSGGMAKAIDTVSDTAIEQKRKNDLVKIRKEVMTGRKPISQYIKYAMAIIAWDTGVIPAFSIVPIVMSIRKRKRMKQGEQMALINELRTELEIINEKIKDSEMDNDRQKKYNYMRLRREIQRAIDQIKFGQNININRHAIKL